MMDISQEVIRAITKKALSQVDMEKLAKRLAPQIEQEIEKGVIQAVRHIEWGEAIEQFLWDTKYVDSFGEKLMGALGIAPKRKK
jgi:hypothetical protein